MLRRRVNSCFLSNSLNVHSTVTELCSSDWSIQLLIVTANQVCKHKSVTLDCCYRSETLHLGDDNHWSRLEFSLYLRQLSQQSWRLWSNNTLAVHYCSLLRLTQLQWDNFYNHSDQEYFAKLFKVNQLVLSKFMTIQSSWLILIDN